MYTIILTICIFIAISFYLSRKDQEENIIKVVYIGLSVGFGILFGGGIAGTAVLTFSAKEDVVILDVPLVSMKDKDNREGSFFLAFGSISDVSYYQYYTKQNGGYKRRKINADKEDITIFEVDDPKPSLKVIVKKPVSQYENWVVELTPYKKKYFFYVPVGSIRKDFKLE